MRFGRAGQRDRSAQVAEPVTGFVDDEVALFLQLEVGRVAAALDHELWDYAMKNRVVVEAGVDELEEMVHRVRCGVAVEFQQDAAHRRVDLDIRVRRRFGHRFLADGDQRRRKSNN